MRSKGLLAAPSWLNQLHALPPSIRFSLLHPQQHLHTSTLPQLLPRTRTRTTRFSSTTTTTTSTTPSPDRIIRPLVAPPREGSGPLLSRRPDRALPNPPPGISIWLKTLPIFVLIITLSSLAIFNYEKLSSSTVNSILYALRTSSHARDLLGDEIYFASKVPWISGQLAPMQGTIDISFWVKGTKGTAKTKFVALKKRGGFFETLEWSLHTEDGQEVQLLEQGARDPLAGQNFD